MALPVELAVERVAFRTYHQVGIIALRQVDVGCQHTVNSHTRSDEGCERVHVFCRSNLHHLVRFGSLSHSRLRDSCQAYQGKQKHQK